MKEYNLYAAVKPTAGLQDFSVAQDFLLKKIESRELRSLVAEFDNLHTEVYRMATGERSPGYFVILKLKNIIPPVWWFTEKKSTKVKAKPKKKKEAVNLNLSYIDSKGYKEFCKYSVKEWIGFGLDYQYALKLSKQQVRVLTFIKMLEMSEKISPDKWFEFE